jgi:hypothetical protein
MNSPNFGPVSYPLEKFHVCAQESARELSNYLQAPHALIGMSLLAVKSAACQGVIDVKLPTGQVRSVSLNLFGIAKSGERKSAIDDLVAKPLLDHHYQRQVKHEVAMGQYEHSLSLWEDYSQMLQRKRASLVRRNKPTDVVTEELAEHQKAKPVLPRLRQLIRRDLSGRAFADALHGDGESIALMSAEGGVLLRSDAMKQLATFNITWDGSTLSLDRANSKSVLARHPRVTVSIVAQPTEFQHFMAHRGEQARGTGHLARYLVGWPASTQGIRLLSEQEPTWEHLTRFHHRVRELLTEYDRRMEEGAVQRTVITFSDEAKHRWIRLVNDTERRIHPQGDLHDVNDFASKSCEIIGRVAAILHHFSSQEGSISIDTLERAIGIVGWHLDEFRRLFSARSDLSIVHNDAYILAEHLAQVWLKGICAVRRTDILRLGPLCLRNRRRLIPALDVLIANGAVWISQEKRGLQVNLNGHFFNNFGGL